MTPSSPPPTHPKVLLFLDFDGVLHPFFPLADKPDAYNQHFSFLPAFEAAVRNCPCQVEIVIASSWRRKFSLNEMRGHFSPDIAKRIIAVTPQVGAGTGPGARLAEVQAWLRANGREGQPWVAVDDMADLYDSTEHVALVDCQDCFADREADLLRQAVCDPAGYARSRPPRGPKSRQLWVPPGTQA